MSVRIDPKLIDDPQVWAWLKGRLNFGRNVRSWVPGEFGEYARILHPAQLWGDEGEGVTFVSWQEISRWSGKPLTATSSFFRIALRSDGTVWGPPQGSSRPLEGDLVSPFIDRLTQLLETETSAPERVWFLVWSGYGSILARGAFDLSKPLRSSGRSYVLRRGAIDSLVHEEPGPHISESPSFWWPDDRAWFVSTDIDTLSTYVGGGRSLVSRLLADDLLEAFPAELDDRFDGEATPEEARAVLTGGNRP
ncbi:MAG TPA: hypothetical protein VKA30_05190 [Actinomycetota bacterium]|nr:hypothetical protein [Actinomycetota bacterium]